ncbi:glucose-1-phosphate thymidylyltransferase RfbA [Candidatus Sumerlaeota bacterium]|nr:glucose-1-phosphate thymidylyltransferase RfbA [Candidatus Sumerlaeota bacterium]
MGSSFNTFSRKGILLAGGSGSRLHPLTQVASKQLLPIYDKPLVYYPLSTLMLAGIRDVLLISTPSDLPRFEHLLGDGSSLGMNISYVEQPHPEGIAQAFLLGENFLGNSSSMLILGDNIFYGNLRTILGEAAMDIAGATVFGYFVNDPERYGVIEFDKSGKAISIEEKPSVPKSNYAVPGLYFYDNQVVDIVKVMKPSARGELEITDVNKAYMSQGALRVLKIRRGVAWLDTGTPESMLDACNFIATIERRQGLKVGCIEEVALRMGFIDLEQYQRICETTPKSPYKRYLESVMTDFQSE